MNVNLIPRKVLFDNPHRSAVRISPDGNRIAYLANDEGVMNVWVAPIDDLEHAKVVTRDRSTGIGQYHWAYTSEHILFFQDRDGDEDFHLYRVDLTTDEIIDLTPFDQISAQLNHLSHRFPEEALVGVNDRGEHWFHDIYRINIVTGERQLIEQNDQFIGFLADDNFQVRIAMTITPESDIVLCEPVENQDSSNWQPFMHIPASESMTTAPIGFDAAGQSMYMLDSRERDTAAIKTFNLQTQESTLVFADDRADVNGALTHPTENTIQSVSYTYDRLQHEVLDESLRSDFEYLNSMCDGEMDITSQTIDQTKWIVAFTKDDGPVRYYLYDRTEQKEVFLFSHRPELDELELAKMYPVSIESRDGWNLVSYLTLPVDSATKPGSLPVPSAPLPLVLLVHGGPWYRDWWGYDPIHQMLSNRGYAVLSVNFRGSVGFGKSFINAANMEWAGKMHDDLVDAVQWAIENGIADKNRIGIMGASYGGYATLVALTMTPETFACGIDIVGPSNLVTLMENPPPYWMPTMPMMATRVGDHTTEQGRKDLESRSPLFYVDKIQRPLLIGQGANDPRVKQAESDQIVAAMEQREIPVTYVLYPEEGHGFDRPENDISFYAICESFLAEHLGGRCEDVGNDFEGAKFEIKSGLEHVAGIAEALS